jgi:DNA polymerase-3 subunit alpha
VPKFLKAAKKVGIKPIVGCEIYIQCGDSPEESPEQFDKLNHLTILTKNANGFKSLTKVLSYAHKHHYIPKKQKAAAPIEYILEELKDCVVLSGCFSSPFWRGTERAADELVMFKEKFKDDFFLEAQALHDWDKQIELNRVIYGLSNDLDIPLVVTPDCHFDCETDHTFHRALLAVASRKSMNDPKAWKFSTKQIYLMPPERIMANLILAGVPDGGARRALENTARVNDRISLWNIEDLPAPTIPLIPGNMTEIAWQGLMELGLRGRPEYDDRLERELKTFATAGLDRYLLLVRHCVRLFKENGAEIGPRGSVGGSLLAYCLGITPIDPIEHGLSFERFYAPGRKGWPDVDLDFDEETRAKVPEILRKEFGEDNVAQISNYSTFGLRMSVKDAAKAYGIEIQDDSKAWTDDKDADKIEDIAPGLELIEKSPDAAAFARKLYDRVRQYGAHAGGFVISSEPLTEGRGCIVTRGKDKALCWDMKTAEELGFIKLDFLGVDSLTAIQKVGSTLNIDWKTVPLDDPQVFEDISAGLTAGVPQFLTSGLRNFIMMLKPTKFEDLVWANAAFRPGALGQMSPQELAETYNRDPGEIIVYQEDVMRLCVEIAGFTWTEADGVRKEIAKSKGIDAMKAWEERFVQGAIKTCDSDPESARAFWKTLENFGRYAFNKSHANSYSWNAYRIAWAKRHHPIETFTALLNCDEGSINALIEEAPEYGVEILPPDANKSGLTWKVENDPLGIRMPITMLADMNLRIAKIIIGRRPFANETQFTVKMTGIKYPPKMTKDLFSQRMPDHNFALPMVAPVELFPKKKLEEFRDETKECDKCQLRGTCKRPVAMEIGKTNIMVVGEAPGRDEDRAGRPFVGKSGRLVDDTFVKYGISGADLTWTNTCHCAPPFIPDDAPAGGLKKSEVEKLSMSCPWVHREIEMLKPPLIIAFGKRAWNALGGDGSIVKANGTILEKNGIKIMACIHPAYVMRDQEHKMPEFERTIKRFAKLYRTLVPTAPKEAVKRLPDPPSIAEMARRRAWAMKNQGR